MSGRQTGVRRSRWPAAVALLAASAWACIDATDVDLLEITGSGVLFGQVFLDVDLNGVFSQDDDPIADADVRLVTSATSELIEIVTTDSSGVFWLADVPVGSYRVALDPALLGDSLTAVGANDAITIELGDTTRQNLGASYEELTIEDALLATPGRRLFTSGIALNSRVNFGDGQVHLKGDSAFLRGLNVERRTVDPGDSVRFLGRVVVDNGRPALVDVSFAVLIPSADVATPAEVSTADAATADGGPLDAALVRIRNAEITDTSTTVDGHFRFWADDGTDSVEFVIRDFLVQGINTSVFRPDTVVRIQQAIGLLSPMSDGTGSVRWRFLPRGAGDIAMETKLADVGVTTAFDTAQASMGDTVEITVTVSNAGPLTGGRVQVSDTIPTGLAFLSSTVTRGSYDDATGLWDVGSLVPGASDTLRMSVEVTVAGPVTVVNVAESLGLLLEVDPTPGNDAAGAGLDVS